MRLVDFLVSEAVKLDFDAADKWEVIEWFARRFYQAHVADSPEVIKEVMFSREEIGTTGVGHGIAIPHGKGSKIHRIALGFMRLKSGVDFGSVDGQKVDLVFAIVAPSDQAHAYLKLLAQLSKFLKTEGIVNKLREVKEVKDIVGLLESV